MKIGFPNNPRKDLLKEIQWIGKNNFDFVDLFLEEDKATPEIIDIEKIRKVLEEHELEVVGHTAWYLPIGSPMKGLRDSAAKIAALYFKVFSELGAKYVTIHANWPRGMFSVQEGIKFQIESLKNLLHIAADFNLGLMYEPVDTPDDNLKNVRTILDEVPDLNFHLDIGHANLHGKKPAQFVEAFYDRLKHVHLHDNNRYSDLHLPMGCGNINWHETIKSLKKYYDGTITLEVFSRDKDYVLLTRDKLLKAWSKA